MIKIRASSLPRIMGCPASAQEPDLKIDTTSDIAIMGTAVHAVLEKIVKEDLDQMPDLSPFISKYKIEDIKELRILAYTGLKAWRENIRPNIKLDTLIIEDKMSFELFLSDETWIEIEGHPDIAGMSQDEKNLIVVDWKSGYLESDYTNQLKGYGYMALEKIYRKDGFVALEKDLEKIIIITVWLRSGTFDVKEYSYEEIAEDFINELVEALLSDTYSPAPDNCRYCPVYDCKAKAVMTRSSITSLVEMSSQDDSEALTLSMASAYPKIQMVEKAAEHARSVIKQHIEDTGNRIKIDEGKYLGIREMNISTIHLIEAMPIVAAFLIPTPLPNYEAVIMKISSCLNIKKTALLELVALTAGNGEIGKRKKEFIEALENAGAMTTTKRKSLAIFKEEK